MDLKRWKIFDKLDPMFAADIKRVYLIGITSRQEVFKEHNKLPWKGSVMVMTNDDVYTVVSHANFVSLLCVDDTSDLLPHVPIKIDALCGTKIRAISSGAMHVRVLGMDGRIYEWGKIWQDNKWNELQPRFVSGNLEGKRVMQIACGHLHSLALTEEGEVYSWGHDNYGQLGIGRHSTETEPVKVSGSNGFESEIVSVACAGWTSFALDIDGNVWSWGDSSFGVVGNTLATGQLIPMKISVTNVKKIVAGDYHALALTNDDTVYFWGQQYTWEGDSTEAPEMVEVPEDAVDIAATRGCTISALKTTEGKVYFWGFACGHLMDEPVSTQYSSFDELFNSMDPPMMLGPMEFQPKQPVMMDRMRDIFDDSGTADIKFNVQGRLIHAHKFVLMLRSVRLDNIITSCSKDRTRKSSRAASVLVDDCTYEAFRTFLLYLYTDRIEPLPRTADNVIELYKLAVKYEEDDLKRRCEQQMEVFVTRKNVCKVYSLAVEHDSKVLHDLAMDLIIPHYNAIVKTDEYADMSNELKNSLTLLLAAEDVFVGLKRKRKE